MAVAGPFGTRGAHPRRRLGGVGIWLADEIARRTGAESRAVVPGHIQRGGTPTAYDRVLSTRFGVHAVDAVHEGDGGVMVAFTAASRPARGITPHTPEISTDRS